MIGSMVTGQSVAGRVMTGHLVDESVVVGSSVDG